MPSEVLNQLAASLPAKKASMAGRNTSCTKPVTEFERWKFALSLPIMDAEILPEHAKMCPFCSAPYNPRFEVAGEHRGHETATMFPCCRSVVGFHCARDWLLPHEGSFDFCPFCEKGFQTSTGAFEWHVSTTEELLESGMATLAPQSTIDTDASGEDGILSAGSSNVDVHDITSPPRSYIISGTDPKSRLSPGTRAKIAEHITNADVVESSSQAIAESPVGEERKLGKFKLRGWSHALAAAKAASRTHHRVRGLSGSRSGKNVT